eukprot:15347436-Ditylum_brightwellii.AAC.1
MMQYHVPKGLQVFGKDGLAAVDKELREMVMRDVMTPLNPDKMKRKEKQDALKYIMFLTKKRCDRVKGRGCTYGCKQQSNTHWDDTSSPTVSTAALLLICVINAKKNRDVATLEVPNAFIQADMDTLVNIKIEGSMAEFLVNTNPVLYRKHLSAEHGKPVINVQLKKALYGTICAALFFLENMANTIQE